MMNTFVATAAAGLSWMVAERLNRHKASALGFCSGIVAGLVAVTPAAGNSGPFGAIVLGAVASFLCYHAVSFLKPKLGYEDRKSVVEGKSVVVRVALGVRRDLTKKK